MKRNSYTSLYKTFVELIIICFQKVIEQCLTQAYFLKADFFVTVCNRNASGLYVSLTSLI